MANWINRLDIKNIWNDAKTGNIKPHELAAMIAEQMKKQLPDIGVDGLEICGDFEVLAADETCTFDDTDLVMEALYDWADREVAPYGCYPANKMCWIATF